MPSCIDQPSSSLPCFRVFRGLRIDGVPFLSETVRSICKGCTKGRVEQRPAASNRWPCFFKRAAIVLLLLAIPVLSTLAKNSWYLPQTNTAHYLNGAIKMKVSHAPLLARWEPPMPPEKLDPAPATNAPVPPERPRPKVRDIGVILSLQHRSPPFTLV